MSATAAATPHPPARARADGHDGTRHGCPVGVHGLRHVPGTALCLGGPRGRAPLAPSRRGSSKQQPLVAAPPRARRPGSRARGAAGSSPCRAAARAAPRSRPACTRAGGAAHGRGWSGSSAASAASTSSDQPPGRSSAAALSGAWAAWRAARGPGPVDRAGPHDAMQPGPDGRRRSKRWKRADGSQKGLLGDVLGRRGVVDDQERGPVRPTPVGAKERLHCLIGAGLRCPDPGALAAARRPLASHRPGLSRCEFDSRCARRAEMILSPGAQYGQAGPIGPAGRLTRH